jgi:hypothetical protein
VPFKVSTGDNQVKPGALRCGPKGVPFAPVCRGFACPYNVPFFVVDSFEMLQLRDSSEAF